MSQDHEQPYAVRVWNAYRELAEQYQTPDVPIHAIHGRVGGSIADLNALLRAESLAHRAVATTGEPTLAGDAARQSALTLPGETETFLRIKLLNPPVMTQQQPPQQQRPTITLTLNVNQADLVAEALHYGAYELDQYADGHGRDIDGVETHCDYLGDLEKGLMAFVRNPKEHAGELRVDAEPELPDQAVAKRYERLLRETAALRYPAGERTPELEARIEATIRRKVGEFNQERHAREQQQDQASYQVRQEGTGIVVASYPTLKEASDRACRWEEDLSIWMRQRDGTCREMAPQEVTEMLTAQKRREVAQQRRQQQQQQAQPPPQARSQEQGRDMER